MYLVESSEDSETDPETAQIKQDLKRRISQLSETTGGSEDGDSKSGRSVRQSLASRTPDQRVQGSNLMQTERWRLQ